MSDFFTSPAWWTDPQGHPDAYRIEVRTRARDHTPLFCQPWHGEAVPEIAVSDWDVNRHVVFSPEAEVHVRVISRECSRDSRRLLDEGWVTVRSYRCFPEITGARPYTYEED
jgi:hypothetical protein